MNAASSCDKTVKLVAFSLPRFYFCTDLTRYVVILNLIYKNEVSHCVGVGVALQCSICTMNLILSEWLTSIKKKILRSYRIPTVYYNH